MEEQEELMLISFRGLKIKCFQYLSLRAKCTHVLSAPFFSLFGYNEAKVVNDGFLVRVNYTCALSVVVAPCGDKFGGKMSSRVACHFVDKV